MGDVTPPPLQGPSAKEKKYDRQLRLWAASGQAALEDAHILLINSGPGVLAEHNYPTNTTECRRVQIEHASQVGIVRALIHVKDAKTTIFNLHAAGFSSPRA
ncbi:hypothetical protein LTR16_008667 [Cryomyces antarcticus]|uniref:THIF-type NAD/FAD binding fold domain-containing protein n=1 Tax=Cryomyces antarcticus TaxID=329879 RepID=A0ABR0JY76_9PEZI|nr:hypothetical protein LTR39_005542 [Cryomyces antarcticus]KAK5079434.1 hypothetical protein LTR16_008667 [Cryomyces antarcticus]